MKKLYGPYIRKDGRSHICIYDTITKYVTSQSYPKYLLGQKLGRELNIDETADHIDENPSNDAIENLQILSRMENVLKSVRRAEPIYWKCNQCGNEFQLSKDQKHQTKLGHFCSRSCSGKYGRLAQLVGGI